MVFVHAFKLKQCIQENKFKFRSFLEYNIPDFYHAMKGNYWLQTDELTEAVKALETFHFNLNLVKSDLYYWKWAILALHNAVQGFMVCALRGSNGLGVLTEKSAQKWLKAYEEGGTYPKEKLDTFLNLYEKIKGELMKQYIHSRKFVPQGKEDKHMKTLNTFRNEFIHFKPKGWSIECSGFPQICEDILSIIDFLALKSNNIHFDKKVSLQEQFQKASASSKKLVEELKHEYAKAD